MMHVDFFVMFCCHSFVGHSYINISLIYFLLFSLLKLLRLLGPRT